MADDKDGVPEDMLEALMDKQEEQLLAIYILLTDEEKRKEASEDLQHLLCAIAMCMGQDPQETFAIFNRCKKKGFLL